MDSRSFTFPKGEYFFGDLSYLFPDPINPKTGKDDWRNIFCENREGDWDYLDKEYVSFDTGGDGWFVNERSNDSEERIPVDSASFGLIPTDVVDPEVLKEVIKKENGIILNADYEVKIDVQGENGRTIGVHI